MTSAYVMFCKFSYPGPTPDPPHPDPAPDPGNLWRWASSARQCFRFPRPFLGPQYLDYLPYAPTDTKQACMNPRIAGRGFGFRSSYCSCLVRQRKYLASAASSPRLMALL
ncbi:hypothetical protein CPLU01_03506 [Colletotrichum plurivorum]|uniref:Uncharacterized protein n=1 Tax=Colletotrichum plurivorum TaxID=2175906 RepID=A0A8H6KS85_9PEZI|nr:hypothetical protein CPLU01_03506 [Colletotrichum plurivorum]